MLMFRGGKETVGSQKFFSLFSMITCLLSAPPVGMETYIKLLVSELAGKPYFLNSSSSLGGKANSQVL